MTTMRCDIVNYLITLYDLKSYLEIGCKWGNCFQHIKCDEKVGVDPNPIRMKQIRENGFVTSGCSVHGVSSDEYFSNLSSDKIFDIVFIDGMHTEEQVDKDIKNSLEHLSDHGFIVLHDCSPPTEYDLVEGHPKATGWTGTTYRSIVKLRCNEPNLRMCVVDTDWGCGVIDPLGTQNLYEGFSVDELVEDFNLFDENRKSVLNLISVDEFFNTWAVKE